MFTHCWTAEIFSANKQIATNHLQIFIVHKQLATLYYVQGTYKLEYNSIYTIAETTKVNLTNCITPPFFTQTP
jgi:hypothetical protein